jgi:hypothetical protein
VFIVGLIVSENGQPGDDAPPAKVIGKRRPEGG